VAVSASCLQGGRYQHLPFLSVISRRFPGRGLFDTRDDIERQSSRERLFADILLIVKSIGAPQLSIEILFEGEPGVDIGPMQNSFRCLLGSSQPLAQ
jgi:hypothetical protein